MENEIKPTYIEPTNIEPTEITPTDIKPTEITPTEINPTEIKPTEITPTEINPTEINPTEITPTDIKPTDVFEKSATYSNSAKTQVNSAKVFSNKNAIIYLSCGLVGGLAVLFFGLNFGLTLYMLPLIFATAVSIFRFFGELKKLEITQEALDEWNNQILAKHPNFPQSNLMTMADSNKLTNKLSFWTHTLAKPIYKVLAWCAVVGAVASLGVGIIVPLTTGGIGGGGDVVGVYVQASQHEAQNGVAQVGKTAFKFDSNGNVYFSGYYEGSKTVWQKYGTYTKSGSKVTIQSGYFTIQNGGKTLYSNDGQYWTKV